MPESDIEPVGAAPRLGYEALRLRSLRDELRGIVEERFLDDAIGFSRPRRGADRFSCIEAFGA